MINSIFCYLNWKLYKIFLSVLKSLTIRFLYCTCELSSDTDHLRTGSIKSSCHENANDDILTRMTVASYCFRRRPIVYLGFLLTVSYARLLVRDSNCSREPRQYRDVKNSTWKEISYNNSNSIIDNKKSNCSLLYEKLEKFNVVFEQMSIY